MSNVGYVYKLCCKDVNITDFYIGSSKNVNSRTQVHKSHCNNPNDKKHNYCVYKCIRNNGGFENWHIVILETINFDENYKLRNLEAKYINELKPTLNHTKPHILSKQINNIKDWNKDYKKNNADRIKLYSKEYRKLHADKINQKYICDCGSTTLLRHKKRHENTNKHLKYLQYNGLI